MFFERNFGFSCMENTAPFSMISSFFFFTSIKSFYSIHNFSKLITTSWVHQFLLYSLFSGCGQLLVNVNFFFSNILFVCLQNLMTFCLYLSSVLSYCFYPRCTIFVSTFAILQLRFFFYPMLCYCYSPLCWKLYEREK